MLIVVAKDITFAALAHGSFSAGVVVLRRRTAPRNWVVAEGRFTGRCIGSGSTKLQRTFAGWDLVMATGGDRRMLLATRFAPAPEHVLLQELRSAGVGWRSRMIASCFAATLKGSLTWPSPG